MMENVTCPFCGKTLRFDYEIGVSVTQFEGTFQASAKCCNVLLVGSKEEGGWEEESVDIENAVRRFAENMEAIKRAMSGTQKQKET